MHDRPCMMWRAPYVHGVSVLCKLGGGARIRVVGNLVMVIKSVWLHSEALFMIRQQGES